MVRFMSGLGLRSGDALPGAVEPVRVGSSWLALREPADAAARSTELVELLRRHLPTQGPHAVHDLGCGTGSMGRWLAPRLAGPQLWVLHDRQRDLLDVAAADVPRRAVDGASVTVSTRQDDIARLGPGDLAGATLITASALLDMLTADELDGLVDSCAAACCPVLLTITVVGAVELAPADRLDPRLADAFNAHQRRTHDGRSLLGPDAVARAAASFARHGHQVLLRPSPWRLGPADAALTQEWFAGWLDAALEQEPDLVEATGDYAARRLADAAAGGLHVTVHHQDLLAVPTRPSLQPRRAMPTAIPTTIGVNVTGRVPTGVHLSEANARSLATKARRGGHTLDLPLSAR